MASQLLKLISHQAPLRQMTKGGPLLPGTSQEHKGKLNHHHFTMRKVKGEQSP